MVGSFHMTSGLEIKWAYSFNPGQVYAYVNGYWLDDTQ